MFKAGVWGHRNNESWFFFHRLNKYCSRVKSWLNLNWRSVRGSCVGPRAVYRKCTQHVNCCLESRRLLLFHERFWQRFRFKSWSNQKGSLICVFPHWFRPYWFKTVCFLLFISAGPNSFRVKFLYFTTRCDDLSYSDQSDFFVPDA